MLSRKQFGPGLQPVLGQLLPIAAQPSIPAVQTNGRYPAPGELPVKVPKHLERPKPDHLFPDARILSHGREDVRVNARVFLPSRADKKLHLMLEADPAMVHRLMDELGSCEIVASKAAELAPPGEELSTVTLHATDVHLGGGHQSIWDHNYSEGYRSAFPRTVVITQRWRTPRTEVPTIHGLFALTPSLALQPRKRLRIKPSGEVTVAPYHPRVFQLGDSSITFDTRYSYKRRGNVTLVPSLVAEFELPAEADPLHHLRDLDDLTLLSSLAEGQRCAAREVHWSGPDGQVSVFRCDRSIPRHERRHHPDSFLVRSENLWEFLELAYRTLVASPHRELLRRGLEVLTSDAPGTTEGRFMGLFSAIETFTDAFRLDNNLRYIVKGATRDRIRDRIKDVLVAEFATSVGDRLPMLFEKLPELNRVPARTAIERFDRSHSLHLAELWPLWDDDSKWSLSAIRNRLVHGQHLTEWQTDHVLTATKSLRRIAERMALAYLGWDLNRSGAHPGITSEEERAWKSAYRELRTDPLNH